VEEGPSSQDKAQILNVLMLRKKSYHPAIYCLTQTEHPALVSIILLNDVEKPCPVSTLFHGEGIPCEN
jgi:hypothetical protein